MGQRKGLETIIKRAVCLPSQLSSANGCVFSQTLLLLFSFSMLPVECSGGSLCVASVLKRTSTLRSLSAG